MNRYSPAAGAVTLAVVLAACSSSKSDSKSKAPAGSGSQTTTASSAAPPSGSATAPATGGIIISGFAYSGTLTVKPGEKVTVTNKDAMPHTVTDKKTKAFDTGNIAGNGGTGTFTAPTKAGSYPFGCTFHPRMSGTLVVQG